MAKYSKNIYEQMVLAAKKAYPNECCGILVGKKYMVPGLEYIIMSVQNGEVVDVKSYRKSDLSL